MVQAVLKEKLYKAIVVLRSVVFGVVGFARKLRQVLAHKAIIVFGERKTLLSRNRERKHHRLQHLVQRFERQFVVACKVERLIDPAVFGRKVAPPNSGSAPKIEQIRVVGRWLGIQQTALPQ